MLESSKDILFYVSAIAIIALTVFMCWLLYYFIAIIRNVHSAARSLKKKMDLVEDILKNIKSNVTNAANYIGIVVAGIDKIVDYVQKKKSADKPKKN